MLVELEGTFSLGDDVVGSVLDGVVTVVGIVGVSIDLVVVTVVVDVVGNGVCGRGVGGREVGRGVGANVGHERAGSSQLHCGCATVRQMKQLSSIGA